VRDSLGSAISWVVVSTSDSSTYTLTASPINGAQTVVTHNLILRITASDYLESEITPVEVAFDVLVTNSCVITNVAAPSVADIEYTAWYTATS